MMANPVLLVTLEGTLNFGNRLQHYALQNVIESIGYVADNLMVRTNTLPIKLKIKNSLKTTLVHCGIKKYRTSLSEGKRAERLLKFNSRYLPGCVRVPANEVWHRNWDVYDFAVTGSDQVWHNWHFRDIPDELSLFYLEFIDKKKRVSYAPSFGFTSFPPEDIEQHRRGLTGMHALSCREQEGCELIRELTGREAAKVLDPTLLLTAEDWEQIESKPRFRLPDSYLLQYFLGEVTPDYQMESARISNERSLRIININDPTDTKHYAISPNEFVWLVHHAELICTDSFHASVFSIIFEKKLRVFRRKQKGLEDMFGRLHDLLEPLGLLDLVYGMGEGLHTVLNEKGKEYLAAERDASLSYLRKSLNAHNKLD